MSASSVVGFTVASHQKEQFLASSSKQTCNFGDYDKNKPTPKEKLCPSFAHSNHRQVKSYHHESHNTQTACLLENKNTENIVD